MIPKAKKSLGQHFLHDQQICKRIVALLQSKPNDNVLEIGPGPGALTKILEKAELANFVVLEKDPYWAKERNNALCQAILIDALNFDWQRLACANNLDKNTAWKLIGNLPYNVASPLIWDIVSQAQNVQRAVFMVQKEVGQRITAKPGGKEYGALSVWVQYHATSRLAFTVGKGAFNPAPKIDSAVIVLELKSERPKNPQHLANLLHICFQNRRKQLGSIFRMANLPESILAGRDPKLRPENLSVEDFASIAEHGREFLGSE